MNDKFPEIRPKHKAIKKYYEELERLRAHGVIDEMGLRGAFQNLLVDLAKARQWVLVPEQADRAGSHVIRPDGTLCDKYRLPRGYWEAKDIADDLESEIADKFAKGYPTTNIIFENTKHGVLIQNGQEAFRADLTDPEQLAKILNLFFDYKQPIIGQFDKAVAEFKKEIPNLGKSLQEIITKAHTDNKRFQDAFAGFFELCKNSLNPNIRMEAVDEMLIQHLLTERVLTSVFNNPDFTRKNIIAAEVEKVIDALISKAFNRHEFLKSLDRFYVAIEEAAKGIEDFGDKQKFLNAIYQEFFQGYAVKVADTHGIIYTPKEIVDFMCASVETVLEKEFGLDIASDQVNILDPCTGTGNFIVNIMQRVPRRALPKMYKNHLFANEVMLMPYYIASLNIEHAYYEITGEYEPFEGICFVDTLDLTDAQQTKLGFMIPENLRRVIRQKSAPITVIIGNPPYNMGQVNENDNNKNRKYEEIDKRIKSTYAEDSKATLVNKLYDPYVKFFRWATDRLQGRDGIVCFVSNNSFIDNIAFDGMRKHLLGDFNRLYVLDLKGNIRKDSMRDGIPLGEKHTVFGLSAMVGISISIFLKFSQRRKVRRIFYSEVDFRSTREVKFQLLNSAKDLRGIKWGKIEPDDKHNWIHSENALEFETFLPLGTKAAKLSRGIEADNHEAIFKIFSLGVVTARDDWAYGFDLKEVSEKIKKLIYNYNYEVFRLTQAEPKPVNISDFINLDPSFVKWTRSLKWSLEDKITLKFNRGKIRKSLYRPFTDKYLYFDQKLNEDRYQLPRIFPTAESENENRVICLSGIGSSKPFHCIMTNMLVDFHLTGDTQCFSFYIYDDDGAKRRENITDWALKSFREHYGDKKITKWDIFYYIYGILHHPTYRTKYADDLRRQFPRIPKTPDFRAFSKAGEQLARWHLDYEQVEPYKLKFVESKDQKLSYRVEDKMRLSKDKKSLIINKSLTLNGIPSEALEYRLGNRSALDWIIDQYQVKIDKRSGIKSDPNRQDDPEYIVNLVGRVIRVSIETVKIVKSLPEDFGG